MYQAELTNTHNQSDFLGEDLIKITYTNPYGTSVSYYYESRFDWCCNMTSEMLEISTGARNIRMLPDYRVSTIDLKEIIQLPKIDRQNCTATVQDWLNKVSDLINDKLDTI